MTPGTPVIIDRHTHATYVRGLGNGTVIVQIGADTRVVAETSIKLEEKLRNP